MIHAAYLSSTYTHGAAMGVGDCGWCFVDSERFYDAETMSGVCSPCFKFVETRRANRSALGINSKAMTMMICGNPIGLNPCGTLFDSAAPCPRCGFVFVHPASVTLSVDDDDEIEDDDNFGDEGEDDDGEDIETDAGEKTEVEPSPVEASSKRRSKKRRR